MYFYSTLDTSFEKTKDKQGVRDENRKSCMELSIIAHIDLPGHYRLIRIVSPELSRIIKAGDALVLPAAECKLPYFRQEKETHKIDFLFYNTESTDHIRTHSILNNIILQQAELTLVQMPNHMKLLASNIFALGQGLSIALDNGLRKDIDLFVFELDDCSPFPLHPSRLYLPYMKGNVTGNINLLEEKKIAARFHSMKDIEGCFVGSLNQFIEHIRPFC